MGKNKYIESPDKFWELFQDYKKQTKANPIIIKDWVGKDAEPVYREKEKPLTMVGFECFVCENTKISYPDLTIYFEGKDDSYKDYFPIASRIKAEIQNDMLTGGMTMIYSQSLTARLANLPDRQDITTDGKELPNTALKVEILRPTEDDEE